MSTYDAPHECLWSYRSTPYLPEATSKDPPSELPRRDYRRSVIPQETTPPGRVLIGEPEARRDVDFSPYNGAHFSRDLGGFGGGQFGRGIPCSRDLGDLLRISNAGMKRRDVISTSEMRRQSPQGAKETLRRCGVRERTSMANGIGRAWIRGSSTYADGQAEKCKRCAPYNACK